jgi:hypothetical protein
LCYNDIFCIFYRFYRKTFEMWYFFLAHTVFDNKSNFSRYSPVRKSVTRKQGVITRNSTTLSLRIP